MQYLIEPVSTTSPRKRAAPVVRQRTDALDELRPSVVDVTGVVRSTPRQLAAMPRRDSEFAQLRAVGDRFALFWKEARDEPADPLFTVYQYYALFDGEGGM